MIINKISNYSRVFFSGLKIFFLDTFFYFYVKLYFIFLLIINLAIWLAAFLIAKNITGDLMYLHYDVDFGVNLIGKVNNIYLIPALGSTIILVNVFLYGNISKHRDRKFISHILFVSAIVANLILLISIVSIYLVNFR